jgi:hypothetical protein
LEEKPELHFDALLCFCRLLEILTLEVVDGKSQIDKLGDGLLD